jgi:NAD(P)H dehydrogenase (quinone)
MKTLIVYAHPNHESHAKETLRQIEEKLTKNKIPYEIFDLYKMKFNPVLSTEELYEAKTKGPPKEIITIQHKINNSEHLIFVYPIWWNGMPAILKGFIDRVFSRGYAFQYTSGMPQGLLNGKKATVFVSTGSKKWITCLFLGNRFKKNAVKDIFGFCGIKTKVYQVDSARALNDKQKEKIRKNVEKALG